MRREFFTKALNYAEWKYGQHFRQLLEGEIAVYVRVHPHDELPMKSYHRWVASQWDGYMDQLSRPEA